MQLCGGYFWKVVTVLTVRKGSENNDNMSTDEFTRESRCQAYLLVLMSDLM
jgi:hypothetical protein